VPDGLWVLHTCDNPSCCRLDHLYLGSNAENVRDRVERIRGRSDVGERGANAKLTNRQAEEIRQRYAAGDITQAELGAEYGVRGSVVSAIWTGRTRYGYGTSRGIPSARRMRSKPSAPPPPLAATEEAA
jgi:hypothetical protein